MLELTRIVETILFTANKPLKLDELTGLVRQGATEETAAPDFVRVKEEQILEAIERLRVELEPHGLLVQELAGGFRMATKDVYAPWVRAMFEVARAPKLSQPALETLVDRGIVRVAGRADVPGRPLIYETTEFFLEHFGLRDLNDLPNVEELKRVKLPEAKKVPEGQSEFIDENGEVAEESAPLIREAADGDVTADDESNVENNEEQHDELGANSREN
jgi:segregation and condensation protein B